MKNKTNCRPDYRINIVYCGGRCVSHYRDENQTLKLVHSEYSENHMIVSSSDRTDYNDVIKYHESKYCCMMSNGCFVNIPKPYTSTK